MLHEIGEVNLGLVVSVIVGLEEEGMVLEEAGNLAVARESELLVELVSVIEADDVLRLGKEKLFRCMKKWRRVSRWRMPGREGMRWNLGLHFFS